LVHIKSFGPKYTLFDTSTLKFEHLMFPLCKAFHINNLKAWVTSLFKCKERINKHGDHKCQLSYFNISNIMI
jgi:hypothetical protein